MEKSSLLRTDKEITDIYYRNVQSVFRVAYMYLGNNTDAEDIVQNVFITFMDKNPEFNDMNHEKAWFVTVTKNKCKNLLKSFWKGRQGDFSDLEQISYEQKFKEEDEIVDKLKKLKRDYRVVIYLYYYEGFSVKEIGNILNKSESTIQTWLARGREKLRIELGGELYEA